MLLGAVAGLLTARRRLFGHLVFWAMAAVSLVAAMSRPDFTPLSLLPLAVGVVVWAVLLDYLTGAAQPRAPRVEASRRRFLLTTGGVAVAAVAVAAGGRLVGQGRRAVETSRGPAPAARHGRHRPRGRRDRCPRGPDALAGAERRLLPDRHRPGGAAVDPADWKLRIHGLVDREIEITYGSSSPGG